MSDNNTKNQTWLITGASSGFGAAFARYALTQGHDVVLTARRLNLVEEIASSAPDRALAVQLDVTQRAQIANAVSSAVDRFGGIDVLINNAGYGIVGALEETPEAELRALMETNFFGAVAMTQAVLPLMRKQQQGAIVMMSAVGGQAAFSGFAACSAAKFAMEGWTEGLAKEIAPFGIKTMLVEPGAFRTDFAGPALRHMPKMDAYAETVGPVRDFARIMDGTQPGDPMKGVAAVAEALKKETPPLRLALGDDAVDFIRLHAQGVLSDIASWETVSRSVNLDEANNQEDKTISAHQLADIEAARD